MGLGQTVEYRRHAAPTVDAGANEDADLIQQAGVQKAGVDGRAAQNGHALPRTPPPRSQRRELDRSVLFP